jgi:diphosphomevalonate decarboxylase
MRGCRAPLHAKEYTLKKSDVVAQLLAGRNRTPGESGHAFAPANIALCKYWGKRDEELNLPVTSSLSLSLGQWGATTCVEAIDGPDAIFLDNAPVPPDQPFAVRLSAYLDLFRTQHGYRVRTSSRVPVAAGLASSASGFAALALALDALYNWQLDRSRLSILARLGSGSACRSVYNGFVEWQAGTRADGMDSLATPLDVDWPALRLGWITLTRAAKPISSRVAMRRTRATSKLYTAWPEQVAADLATIKTALAARDFDALGQAAEANALAMHATMMAAWPPVCYWLPETVETLHTIWRLRAEGLPVYATMDAGPNVKILYRDETEAALRTHFPSFTSMSGGGTT